MTSMSSRNSQLPWTALQPPPSNLTQSREQVPQSTTTTMHSPHVHAYVFPLKQHVSLSHEFFLTFAILI